MRFLEKLRYIGVSFAKSPLEKRSIQIANGISLILFGLGICLFVIYYIWYGWNIVTASIPVISVFCLLTVFLNHFNFSSIGRFFVCAFVPIATMGLSIYAKMEYYDSQEELDYFTFRFIILAACVLPPVLFSFKEKELLFTACLLGLAILMLHDPLHEYFNVPYRKDNLKESNYAFTNVVVLVTYLLMVGAVVFMKWLSEKSEEKAGQLIEELNVINKELTDKNTEIEQQNQEILAQSEHLNSSQQKLSDAYKVIEDQRNLLYRQNINLSSELIEKNKELIETNSELIKHNNELRQFSFTVSHNLRGPVASLMGLIKLFDTQNLSGDNAEIFSHIDVSSQRLDSIIRDLSKIIDIRHDIFQIRQKIDLASEINEIVDVLSKEIQAHDVQILSGLSKCPILYSVKPMVYSILYNLISNAIKYRSDRPSVIEISSNEDESFYYLEVKDNGLGIDLKNNRKDLFKLYKRFHFHTEGKGLGLFLVKLQAEALGGSVDVESEMNNYTKFTVKLRKPENAQRQILYRKPYAEIFFDAKVNSIGTIWHGPVSSEQYRNVFQKCIEFVKVYKTPNYIADISNEGSIEKKDQLWMFSEVMPQASHNGLTRIAAVRPNVADADTQEYLKRISENLMKLGISQKYFHSMEEATDWIQQENEKSSSN